jgi:Na+(H+)/acetate symporter ActP
MLDRISNHMWLICVLVGTMCRTWTQLLIAILIIVCIEIVVEYLIRRNKIKG